MVRGYYISCNETTLVGRTISILLVRGVLTNCVLVFIFQSSFYTTAVASVRSSSSTLVALSQHRSPTDCTKSCDEQKGNTGLKTAQYKLAMQGDKSMLIWLGKQRLGQVDKKEVVKIEAEPDKMTLPDGSEIDI